MEKQFDILVVGELNVDLILDEIKSFPEIGTEILADKMNLSLGSSSAIFASNISVLGSKTAFAGMMGEDSFGQLVLSSLSSKNVDTRFITQDKTKKTGATIALNYGEERAMVTFPGAMKDYSVNDIPAEAFKLARHLHLSSPFLQDMMKKDIVQLFKIAKEAGMTTSLDVQWDPEEKWDIDFEALLPFVDVFLPNQNELLAISKMTSVERALKFFTGLCKVVVAKLGSEGSVISENGAVKFFRPFLNNNVVDAIGAGDSFNSGFLHAMLKGKDLDSCMEMGNLMGAINTTASGGTGAFTSKDEIKERAIQFFNKKIQF
ncbi:MAG: carbohydrate kinase family protein [Bacteroidales bacterium]|nr:carbohydrate kinase family protein [Bacteroidales bacterium]